MAQTMETALHKNPASVKNGQVWFLCFFFRQEPMSVVLTANNYQKTKADLSHQFFFFDCIYVDIRCSTSSTKHYSAKLPAYCACRECVQSTHEDKRCLAAQAMPTDISGEFCRSSVQTAHSATQCILEAALNCLATTRNTPRTTGNICWQGLIALLAETRNIHPEHTISSISINRKCSW